MLKRVKTLEKCAKRIITSERMRTVNVGNAERMKNVKVSIMQRDKIMGLVKSTIIKSWTRLANARDADGMNPDKYD